MGFMEHIGSFAGAIWEGMKEHSHTVLAIGAIAGLTGSIILTYKKAPKISSVIDEQREKVEEAEDKLEKGEITEEEFKAEKKDITKETVKRLAPEVGPIAGLGLATAGCMIGTAAIGEMRLAHVRDLISISETYNRELNYNKDLVDKMKEELGEEKTREIKDKIAEEHALKETEKSDWESMILQAKGGGHELYWDELSGRMFYCDDLTIREAVLSVNERIKDRTEWMPLAAIYSALELPCGTMANNVGAGGMYCKVPSFELSINSAIKLGNGRSATVFDFWNQPEREEKPF